MKIIELAALENGAHNNVSADYITEVPPGWAEIPDAMEIPDTFPFVDIEAENGVVIAMTAGTMPEPEPVPAPVPSAEATAEELLDIILGGGSNE